ncbi:cupin domain-containing protein [Roseibium sp. MMSF_3412]|uniref:cupin domain-containing protein n=1 Tax=Roseibium sp. MMSF_3412 TaxID=3046712 RepID=UPI00273DC0B8|nr:cupin domain-containing protein [Roseibium sp. MMSF_3412]
MKLMKSLGAAALSLIAGVVAHEADADEIKLSARSDLEWQTTGEGVAFAPLRGNRFEESYMAMVRLPAGLVSPVHVKSAGMFGLVVTGEMVHVAGDRIGGREKVLKSGDYYEIPAGLPHLSKCVSQIDCVTFLYQDGPFDFLPVGEGRQ